jgi:hypothetical protein
MGGEVEGIVLLSSFYAAKIRFFLETAKKYSFN